MKYKNKPFRYIIIAFACILIFSGCHNKQRRLKNGQWVFVTSNTIFVDSAQAVKYLDDSITKAEFSKDIQRFYTSNSFFLAWDSFVKPGGLAEKFIKRLKESHDEGFDSSRFRTVQLQQLLDQVQDKPDQDTALRDLDVLLTTEFLKYAANMREGITRMKKKDLGWVVRPVDIPGDSLLKIVLKEHASANPFAIFEPPHDQYLKLRKALVHYRKLLADGGWPLLPANLHLKPGDTAAQVLLLRKRLEASKEYHNPGNKSNLKIYDHILQADVKAFQKRHGIMQDGIVQGRTLAALNMTAAQCVNQIVLNMERWRLVPPFPKRYLMVNVPEYTLHVYDDGREVWNMRTIVGKDYKATPVFDGMLSSIVFSPYWNIPNSITEQEVLPAWQRNPLFLARNHMEAVDGFDTGAHVVPYWLVNWKNINEPGFHYRLRQRPGDDNPLGPIKFMFPNNFNVYLHGTAHPELFNREVRMFSHGCVRIEDPVKLARFILGENNPEWTEDDIRRAMSSGHEQWISVPKTQVYILYFTAWVDNNGILQQRDDIYGMDKTLGDALGLRQAVMN